MAAMDSTSELQTTGGHPPADYSPILQDESEDLSLAVIIIENRTGCRLQTLTAGPGIRGNVTMSPQNIRDIEPSASVRWVAKRKDANESIGSIIAQMGYLIVDRSVILDCPTVGFEWTCFDDGDQEMIVEVNDEEEVFEGNLEKMEEDGIPKWVFTIRKKN
ncbi:hypothetical protein H072_3975 [Dactylellina haptotyla CBS 200.50]|uniref:Uncharacterized protein n=1 Tax=Dactylellina haptotyla (strain CBS 200.50) TaxID=1284197 RepID=S8BRT8_DACHA|nr:hypothetical protein H072_3975 [Dactylellina haptotyla CBS 200.50]